MKLLTTELPDSVGVQGTPSDWLIIDQQMLDDFAQLTGDHQWIHVDSVKCLREGMPGTIAHGFLLIALMGGKFPQCFELVGASRTINAGLDRVRFLRPVVTGSRIRVHAQISEVSPRPEGLRARYAMRVEVEGEADPAAVAELILLHLAAE